MNLLIQELHMVLKIVFLYEFLKYSSIKLLVNITELLGVYDFFCNSFLLILPQYAWNFLKIFLNLALEIDNSSFIFFSRHLLLKLYSFKSFLTIGLIKMFV